MRIVILGASRLGALTGRKLIDDGHEVVFVDRDRDVLESLGEDLDCGLIRGDGTAPSVLRDALGDGADVLVALSGSDTVNTLSAAVARSVGFPRVIPQVDSPDLLPVLDELGIDEAIAPVDSVADTLVANLTARRSMSAGGALRHNLRLVVQKVPERMDDTRLGTLDLPSSARVVAHMRDDTESLPDADTQLRSGDNLLMVLETDALEALEEMFAG